MRVQVPGPFRRPLEKKIKLNLRVMITAAGRVFSSCWWWWMIGIPTSDCARITLTHRPRRHRFAVAIWNYWYRYTHILVVLTVCSDTDHPNSLSGARLLLEAGAIVCAFTRLDKSNVLSVPELDPIQGYTPIRVSPIFTVLNGRQAWLWAYCERGACERCSNRN